jgi:hypothetical protein
MNSRRCRVVADAHGGAVANPAVFHHHHRERRQVMFFADDFECLGRIPSC